MSLVRTAGWAELVAAPTTNLAALPEAVSFSQASTLPVAGLTALYALDRSPGLTGRNVLITGASGGVGHLGVQIAINGGATVTGLVRQEKHIQAVREAGAQNVVADETGAGAAASGPFNIVLESVGGPGTGQCARHGGALRPGCLLRDLRRRTDYLRLRPGAQVAACDVRPKRVRGD